MSSTLKIVVLAAMPSAKHEDHDGEEAWVFQKATKRKTHISLKILEEPTVAHARDTSRAEFEVR